MKSHWTRGAAIILVSLLGSWDAQAVVLDWDTITWTAGSLTNSYDIDSSNPGNDIRIAVSGNTSFFQPGFPYPTNEQTGGLTPSEKTFQLWINSFTTDSQTVTVTVTFLYSNGVDSATTKLFDVDRGSGSSPNFSYVDQVRNIKATTDTGAIVGAVLTGGSAVTLAGSGTNQTATGNTTIANTSSNANLTIDFGANYITQFTFTYGNNAATTQSDPAQQAISLYDISFRPIIPEHGSAAMAFTACLLAIGAFQFTRRRLKFSPPFDPASCSSDLSPSIPCFLRPSLKSSRR